MDGKPDLIMTVDDVMLSGHCPSGLRRWLTDNGIDKRRFFAGEVHASEVLEKGDANGKKVVADKYRRLGMPL